MRLSSNSKKMSNSSKKCRVMVRAKPNKLISKSLLSRKLSTMLVLKKLKTSLTRSFMKLNKRLSLLRENSSNYRRSTNCLLKIQCLSMVRSLKSTRKLLRSSRDCSLSLNRPRMIVTKECATIKPKLISLEKNLTQRRESLRRKTPKLRAIRLPLSSIMNVREPNGTSK